MAEYLDFTLENLQKESERYEAPATEKERAILDAAQRLFGERGYTETTTAQIARTAGVTERTLFKYFPTKADLLKRVMFPMLLRVAIPEQMQKVRTMLQTPHLTFEEWYLTILRDRLQMASENALQMKLILIELLRDEVLRSRFGELWQEYLWTETVRSLQHYQERGLIRQDINLETLARILFCINAGYLFSRYIFAPERNWDDEFEATQMLNILMNGIACEK
jgi:AcrR family transcriptional regulator